MQPSGLYLSDFGASIEDIAPFTSELTGTVLKMKEAMVEECKILEGTSLPEYGKGDWALPTYPPPENELSHATTPQGQWRNVLQNGFLTIVRTLNSTTESSSSVFTAVPLLPTSPTGSSDERYTACSTPSCSKRLDDCGNETVAMNESSECTVPMISEQTDGMRSEAKWSQPPRSMESSEVTLPVVKL